MRPEQQHGSKASHDPAPDTERATGTAARSQRREAVWRLQQRFGNRRSQVVQAKLAVGPVDDPLEREADHIAAQALGSSVHREPADVQQVPLAAGGTVEPAVEAAISRAAGGGHAVPAGVRERMEHATGADLSDVRVHVGAETDRMNDALGARAFTVGSDVFVRRSEYRPGTSEGDALLGHELA
ncbi:MAG: DUF4157 domain-containing protein, partial [Actinomycetota bacterium]|nr:DUF4157 domain-containing protein [Actinomycetota bacterium]